MDSHSSSRHTGTLRFLCPTEHGMSLTCFQLLREVILRCHSVTPGLFSHWHHLGWLTRTSGTNAVLFLPATQQPLSNDHQNGQRPQEEVVLVRLSESSGAAFFRDASYYYSTYYYLELDTSWHTWSYLCLMRRCKFRRISLLSSRVVLILAFECINSLFFSRSSTSLPNYSVCWESYRQTM